MTIKSPRVKWLAELARAHKKRPQHFRDILTRHGERAPYTNEKRLRQILAKAGAIETPTGNGNAETEPIFSGGRGSGKTASGDLIGKLAAMLPGGQNTKESVWYRMQRARIILRQGGYKGPPWTDEARALKIFESANISTTKFNKINGADHSLDATITGEHSDAELLRRLQARSLGVLRTLQLAESLVAKEFKEGKRTTVDDVTTVLFMALNDLRKPL